MAKFAEESEPRKPTCAVIMYLCMPAGGLHCVIDILRNVFPLCRIHRAAIREHLSYRLLEDSFFAV